MRKTTERGASLRVPSDTAPRVDDESATVDPLREGLPRLLVSVRSAPESLVALAGGAAFIDIKEPANGPLGRASPGVHLEVVRALDAALASRGALRRQVTVTAALGELLTNGLPVSHAPVSGISLYKLGLSQCGGNREWLKRLEEWRSSLMAAGASLAAVAYADHARARAPEPHRILDYAIEHRLPFLLVDTYGKGAGSLTDFLSERDLTSILENAHRHGVAVALAGSLRLEDLGGLARLGADVLAVRGAACKHGKREGNLESDRIRELAATLRQIDR